MAAQELFGSLALLFEYPGPGYLENAGRCGSLIARSAPWAFEGFNDFLIPVMDLSQEDKVGKDAGIEHKEILDQNVRAGFRGSMKQERTQKKTKGFFKKMFNRKSGM